MLVENWGQRNALEFAQGNLAAPPTRKYTAVLLQSVIQFGALETKHERLPEHFEDVFAGCTWRG